MALVQPRHLDLRAHPANRILDRNFQIVADIVATPRPAAGSAPPPAPPKHIAEAKQVAQNVPEVAKRLRIKTLRRATGTLQTLVPEPVIRRPLLRVGQNSVRLGGFFELFFGFRVPRIPVRMILHRHLAIRRLQRRIARVLGNAKYLVVVAFRHRTATLTSAGRNSLPLKR
jgi:hypothetical protein